MKKLTTNSIFILSILLSLSSLSIARYTLTPAPLLHGGYQTIVNAARTLSITNSKSFAILYTDSTRTISLADIGNFVTREVGNPIAESFTWQSFDYSTDTQLLGMKLRLDKSNRLYHKLISSRRLSNQSPGDHSLHHQSGGLSTIILPSENMPGMTKLTNYGPKLNLYRISRNLHQLGTNSIIDKQPCFTVLAQEFFHMTRHKIMAVITGTVLGALLLSCVGCCIWRLKREGRDVACGGRDFEIPLFDIYILVASTNNFSMENKLGQGGFGPVYKGKFTEGKEIAIKRLAKTSAQGISEFKNEVMILGKLQHRNLIQLLGCCMNGEEMMLIYEYMPNKSLDSFLFDKAKGALLDWQTRYRIITGIARGLLYLHHESGLRIIHRDLKASNVLLDKNMNPKILDFGMARIFGGEVESCTCKVAGTYGYMSPEYAMGGIFSVKSDVFSFGVLVLEVISGKKNRGNHHSEFHLNLLEHAWNLWKEGRGLELIDESIGRSFPITEALKCIMIGLLCVQERLEDRPTMYSVVSMLCSDGVALQHPKDPGFAATRSTFKSSVQESTSLNEITITTLSGR